MSTKEERDRAYVVGWLADHDVIFYGDENSLRDGIAEAMALLLNAEQAAARRAAFTEAIEACTEVTSDRVTFCIEAITRLRDA